MPIGQAMKMNHETEPFFWGARFFSLGNRQAMQAGNWVRWLIKILEAGSFFVQQAWSTTFHSQLAHLPE